MVYPSQETSRWMDAEQYKIEWGARSVALMRLVEERNIATNGLTFTEYGCGPYSPFSSNYGGGFASYVQADIKKWNEQTFVCDLNRGLEGLPCTDFGVFSGVLEYVDDIEKLFSSLRSCHERLLFSYAVMAGSPIKPSLWQHSIRSRRKLAEIDALKTRALHRGWRNHLDLEELVSCCNAFGYIENIDQWNEHVLILLKNPGHL